MRQHYVLTERGKLMVAMLAAFVLILLSLVLAVIALSSNNSKEKPPQESPNGQSDKEDPSATLIVFDSNAGVMVFSIKANVGETLDDEITNMIYELLSSPVKTKDSTIAVEIPLLADEEVAAITNAVINILTSLEVPINDITFFTYPGQANSEEIIITLYIKQQ